MVKYRYDSRVGQYRSGISGRFVSPSQIAVVVASTVDRLGDTLSDFSDQLIRDRLSVANFQLSVASELKNTFIQLAQLASGGGAIDKAVEDGLGEQLDRLDKFGQAIGRGELSVPQIRARARAYSNSARVAFFQIEALSKARSGIKTAARRLDSQAKHCKDCLYYASLLYVPLSELISPGTNCECNVGCKCSVVYRYY
jgi:hypothetical protein